MEKEKTTNIRKSYENHIESKETVDAVFEIIEKEQPELMDLYVSESGKFLTDTFTYLKDMYDVPFKYRRDLFIHYFGKKKIDIANKWFKKTIRNDNTYNQHLTGHILNLANAVVNEQKRRFFVEPVKKFGKNELKELAYIIQETYNQLYKVCPLKMSEFCVGITDKDNLEERIRNEHNVPLNGFVYSMELVNSEYAQTIMEYFIQTEDMRVSSFNNEGEYVYFYRVENLTTE